MNHGSDLGLLNARASVLQLCSSAMLEMTRICFHALSSFALMFTLFAFLLHTARNPIRYLPVLDQNRPSITSGLVRAVLLLCIHRSFPSGLSALFRRPLPAARRTSCRPTKRIGGCVRAYMAPFLMEQPALIFCVGCKVQDVQCDRMVEFAELAVGSFGVLLFQGLILALLGEALEGIVHVILVWVGEFVWVQREPLFLCASSSSSTLVPRYRIAEKTGIATSTAGDAGRRSSQTPSQRDHSEKTPLPFPTVPSPHFPHRHYT